MQLNKVLQSLLLALPVLAGTACSSHKNANHDEAGMGACAGIENSDSNLSYQEEAHVKMQELQNGNTIYFGLDKYNISIAFTQILDAHATFLRNNASYKVTIEGHTDERGTPEYNIALGERRANSVKMYLQGKGVLADQISLLSYGKEKPAVTSHDEEAYSKNRRAVLVY
ncbi:Peptidoglycan-associated lipoprotein [Serratia symbiotica]|nr:Peptidoglycan-associated lipoprotein [Serratia symbiotica]